MKKLRTGDEVIVISGRDKGKIGKIRSILIDRVIVDGVNKVKKHVKPNPAKDSLGGVVEKELSIHISNVAFKNPNDNKAAKIAIKIIDGKKSRVFKSNGELVDQ